MLSDEIAQYFATKGYSFGGSLTPLIQTSAEPEVWQLTLFNVKGRRHIFESGASAVEAISKMICRVGGTVELISGRETCKLKGLEVAFSGLTLGLSTNRVARP